MTAITMTTKTASSVVLVDALVSVLSRRGRSVPKSTSLRVAVVLMNSPDDDWRLVSPHWAGPGSRRLCLVLTTLVGVVGSVSKVTDQRRRVEPVLPLDIRLESAFQFFSALNRSDFPSGLTTIRHPAPADRHRACLAHPSDVVRRAADDVQGPGLWAAQSAGV